MNFCLSGCSEKTRVPPRAEWRFGRLCIADRELKKQKVIFPPLNIGWSLNKAQSEGNEKLWNWSFYVLHQIPKKLHANIVLLLLFLCTSAKPHSPQALSAGTTAPVSQAGHHSLLTHGLSPSQWNILPKFPKPNNVTRDPQHWDVHPESQHSKGSITSAALSMRMVVYETKNLWRPK